MKALGTLVRLAPHSGEHSVYCTHERDGSPLRLRRWWRGLEIVF
jgi:hypothetical protein